MQADHLSSIPGTHIKGEKRPHKCSPLISTWALWYTHTPPPPAVRTHIRTQSQESHSCSESQNETD